jgi:hypothetical protein
MFWWITAVASHRFFAIWPVADFLTEPRFIFLLFVLVGFLGMSLRLLSIGSISQEFGPVPHPLGPLDSLSA